MDPITAIMLSGMIVVGGGLIIAWRQNCILEKMNEQYFLELREAAEKRAQQQQP